MKALGELRYGVDIGGTALTQLFDYVQLYGFADYGRIWNIDAPLGTPRHDEAASVGGGVRFGNTSFAVDLQAATTVERPDSIAVDDDVGFFFDVVAYF